jgi:gliding motility-associated lipoprotein GldD
MLYGCSEEENPVPKPRSYVRVEYPQEHNYVTHTDTGRYSLAIPDYAVMVNKLTSDTACFRDLEMRGFNATVYITYLPVNNNLPALLEESRELLIKHQIKATDIVDTLILRPEDSVYALMYTLSGKVASNIQFTATDSTRHFLRGSLHFYAPPNYDSLYPMIRFLEKDLRHMLGTLKWEN